MKVPRSTFLALPLAFKLTNVRVLADAALTPLNIGTYNGDIGGQAYYAKNLGLFQKDGLDADVFPFQNGATMASAIIGGSMDVGWANTIALSTAYQHGIDFTILAPANMHVSASPTAGILASLDRCLDSNLSAVPASSLLVSRSCT